MNLLGFLMNISGKIISDTNCFTMKIVHLIFILHGSFLTAICLNSYLPHNSKFINTYTIIRAPKCLVHGHFDLATGRKTVK